MDVLPVTPDRLMEALVNLRRQARRRSLSGGKP